MNKTSTPIELDVDPVVFDFLASITHTFGVEAGQFIDHYLGRISDGNLEVFLAKTRPVVAGWDHVRTFTRGPVNLTFVVECTDDHANLLLVSGYLSFPVEEDFSDN